MSKKKQTRSQKRHRDGRIAQVENLRNQCDDCMNQIKNIDDQIEALYKKKSELQEERDNKEKNINIEMCKIYNDPELISEMIELGTQTTFSRTVLEDIQTNFSQGVFEDQIETNNIESLYELDLRINNELPVEHFGIGGIVKFGNSLQINSEMEDDDDEKC